VGEAFHFVIRVDCLIDSGDYRVIGEFSFGIPRLRGEFCVDKQIAKPLRGSDIGIGNGPSQQIGDRPQELAELEENGGETGKDGVVLESVDRGFDRLEIGDDPFQFTFFLGFLGVSREKGGEELSDYLKYIHTV
jgi:hypothetical protein